MRTDFEYAVELDRQDELAHFRDEFVIDDPEVIYLDGNSLGRLPKRSEARVRKLVEREWGGRLIRGWNDGWIEAPERIGAKIAQLIGAEADEVIVGDSTSVNLFKSVLAMLKAKPQRHKIVTDDLNFPSDLYVMQGALKLAGDGYRLDIIHSPDGIVIPSELLRAAVDQDTAVVVLTHTAFKSGFVYDMNAVAETAHRAGALMLWDLCHSAGAMPLSLDKSGADMAVGCTYKYLNGGPGAPSFLYLRRDLKEIINPIWGWFGQKGQFDFGLAYEPETGIRQFLTGTPSMLSLAPVETGVELLLEAGIDRLRRKSVLQTEYLIGLWEAVLEELGVKLNSPRDPKCRGSHVSLGHPEGMRIDRALIEEMGVIPDFRYPDNIRLGVASIYTRFVDIHKAIMRLRKVIVERMYEKYPEERPVVT